jgi:tRNA(Ile)-lysidine synthase
MKIEIDKHLHIGAAVSGGADSMVLLTLLLDAGAKVSVVHVDHSIRGEASAQDSAFVKEFSEKKSVPFLFRKVDAPSYAEEHGISVELAARELRYAFFEELLTSKKVDVIALAHHLDDQAETVMMRFLRGSGVRGLRGITDRKGYIHPLLGYPKCDILAFARQNGIPYREDATNTDSEYRRNFLRNEALPLLKTRYPDLNAVIGRNAAIFRELEEYLLSEITPSYREGADVYLPVSVLERHPAIAKKSIAEAVRSAGAQKDIESVHLDAIYGLREKNNGARLNLPFNIDVIKEYGRLRFVFREELAPYEMPFSPDGRYDYAGTVYQFSEGNCIVPGRSFDRDKIPPDAVVRTRRTGDVFRRYKGAEKSLSDYLTDQKLPQTERDRLLVLACGSRIYAVLGHEIAEQAKIDKNTKNILIVFCFKGET